MDRPKPTVLPKSLDEDELPVTEEDMNLYNQVNRNCSSRLHEIKKEEISEDEKVRKKLVG
ncbi:9405_t:CDS:2 [Rhizophagus irregularis]|nr:9405_t:CDS:2 [Rhizophagus irregularis]